MFLLVLVLVSGVKIHLQLITVHRHDLPDAIPHYLNPDAPMLCDNRKF